MDLDHPTVEELLPEGPLRDAFDDKSSAFKAGQLIRRLRTQAGLTQKELAERLHVSQARISSIENGDGPDGPTFGVMRRIVAACGYRWTSTFEDRANATAQSPVSHSVRRDEAPIQVASEV